MAFSVMSIGVGAENEAKTLKILSYNVAGLPIDIDVPLKQAAIGKYINENDYDIVAVQEDFTFHSFLAAEVTNYPYQTIHSGSIPWGDGLNIFSKTKIYNESRTEWDSLSGDGFDDWSDHPALDLEFTYTKTDDFVENSDPLAEKKEDKYESIFRRIYYFLVDLVKLLSNWDGLMELLGINK